MSICTCKRSLGTRFYTLCAPRSQSFLVFEKEKATSFPTGEKKRYEVERKSSHKERKRKVEKTTFLREIRYHRGLAQTTLRKHGFDGWRYLRWLGKLTYDTPFHLKTHNTNHARYRHPSQIHVCASPLSRTSLLSEWEDALGQGCYRTISVGENTCSKRSVIYWLWNRYLDSPLTIMIRHNFVGQKWRNLSK